MIPAKDSHIKQIQTLSLPLGHLRGVGPKEGRAAGPKRASYNT